MYTSFSLIISKHFAQPMFGKKKDKEKEKEKEIPKETNNKDHWINPYGTPLEKLCATPDSLPFIWTAAFEYLRQQEGKKKKQKE